jgi:hypothetical protein
MELVFIWYKFISASLLRFVGSHLGTSPMNSSLMWLYGEVKPSSLVKTKTEAKTHHVYLYGEAKPVEQLGINEPVKHGRRTWYIGSTLGECSIMTKWSWYPFAWRCIGWQEGQPFARWKHPSFILDYLLMSTKWTQRVVKVFSSGAQHREAIVDVSHRFIPGLITSGFWMDEFVETT